MKVSRIYSNANSSRTGSARRALAGLILMAVSSFSACGKADMDPLALPTDISYNDIERETVVVAKGDLTPSFEQPIMLSGYQEENYLLNQQKIEEMQNRYEIELSDNVASEGDIVNAGDTLLAFESKVLDDEKAEWESTKNIAILKKENLQNLQAIDPDTDYSAEIADINDDIAIANQHIADVNATYDDMNLISKTGGVVKSVNESIKSGSLVLGTNIIQVVSDDGYYVLDKQKSDETSNSNELAGTMPDMEFKVGDRFKATYNLNEYVVEVIETPSEASANDASASEEIRFKLVGDETLKEQTLIISKEMPVIKNACYVDRRAILTYENETYVFKQMDNGSFCAIKVIVGERVGMDVVIKEGLEEGDVVSIIQ